MGSKKEMLRCFLKQNFKKLSFTKEKTTETQNGNISDKIKGHLNAKVTKWWQSDDEQ